MHAHRPIRPMNVINGDVNRLVNAVKVPVCRACFFSSRAGHATHPLRPTRPRSVRVAAARGDFESRYPGPARCWKRCMQRADRSTVDDRRRPDRRFGRCMLGMHALCRVVLHGCTERTCVTSQRDTRERRAAMSSCDVQGVRCCSAPSFGRRRRQARTPLSVESQAGGRIGCIS